MADLILKNFPKLTIQPKFKAGDFVRCIDATCSNHIPTGGGDVKTLELGGLYEVKNVYSGTVDLIAKPHNLKKNPTDVKDILNAHLGGDILRLKETGEALWLSERFVKENALNSKGDGLIEPPWKPDLDEAILGDVEPFDAYHSPPFVPSETKWKQAFYGLSNINPPKSKAPGLYKVDLEATELLKKSLAEVNNEGKWKISFDSEAKSDKQWLKAISEFANDPSGSKFMVSSATEELKKSLDEVEKSDNVYNVYFQTPQHNLCKGHKTQLIDVVKEGELCSIKFGCKTCGNSLTVISEMKGVKWPKGVMTHKKSKKNNTPKEKKYRRISLD